MPHQPIGKVLSIALRTAVGGPMKEIDAVRGAVDEGLDGDVKPRPDRGVTFLASRQWQQVQTELGVDLPWHTRRANVLVDTESLGDLMGKTVRLGSLTVNILAETRPCGLMDQLHQGLRAVLEPDGRGGVYGRIVQAGSFAVGDEVRVIDTPA